ncbi:MAG: hypothetical protein QM820_04525 [Minicystis sp.]
MDDNDKAVALGDADMNVRIARLRLLQAREEVQKLLDECDRALAVVENAPRPGTLGKAAKRLGVAQRKAGDSVRSARDRIRQAATATGHHQGTGLDAS